MLTNEEIQHLYEEAFKERTTARDLEQRFARAVEAAVLAKLAAAEMPERYDRVRDVEHETTEDVYTEAQLLEYGAACAAQQLSAEPMAWKYTSKLAGNQWFLTSYQSDLSTYKADKVIPLFTRSTT